MQVFWSEFFSGDYMPHGHCYLWQPGILWTNVVSDLVIALSYFSIPFVLLFLVQKRKEQKFKGMFVLFALFIFSCGITHIFSVYTIWHGNYGLHGILKAFTAGISAITAIILYINIDKLIAIPTPSELKTAQENAAEERVKRVRLEIESRANSIFQFSLELFPTGVLVIDCDQKIQITNKMLEDTFGYNKEELLHKDISLLLESEQVEFHKAHVAEYMKKPSMNKKMASGMLVWGINKGGLPIPLEVTLSVHEFENEKYTFASVVSVNGGGAHEKRYLETSRRLQRAVDATDVGIWEWNLLTNAVWFSPKMISYLTVTGTSEEIVFDDWLSHIHPDDIGLVQANLYAHIESKGTYDVVYRGMNNKGEYKWLRTIGDSISDASGKPILMSGTLTSVDRLKHLQTDLENKNQFLDAVLAQSNSAIFIIDIQTNRLKFTNKQVQDLWGYSNQDVDQLLINESLENLFHPDDLSMVKTHLATLRKAKINDKHSFEFRVKHKQGHWVWSLVKCSVYLVDEQGINREILGAALDLTVIKEREESNKQLTKKFSDTFEQAAVGIAHIGLNGNWLKVNGRICEILGYPREELITKKFKDITHPDDLSRDQELAQALVDGKADHYILEKRYIQKNGTTIWARLTVSIVIHDDTERYFVSVIEDISQQKKLEHDLLKSNEELEQFAFVASHDLKEPLRTMQTYTSYLIADLKANKTERVNQDKEFIDSASRRMTSLIDDLLKFSQVRSTEVKLVEINLGELIHSIVDDLQTKISETKTVINIAEPLPNVHSDPGQLRLALQNLIQNAIKFSPKETLPIVTIFVEAPTDKCLYIHVKDNGIGIETAYQNQIFGLFKKLHAANEYQGTGLGLAIVKKIMQNLGGDVSLYSQIGKGSTFTLQIPHSKKATQ